MEVMAFIHTIVLRRQGVTLLTSRDGGTCRLTIFMVLLMFTSTEGEQR